ncbi:MAG: patatin family protein [Solobacterium sp.]|nr:patatin family protein [Solobacterium sp.]
MKRLNTVYSRINEIPVGTAPHTVTEGCLVLEGGGWRGIYTQGVLDVLMQEGFNLQTTIGVSAGAMAALCYLSGQIGSAARFNLEHRFDQNYSGLGALRRDHGVTGFSYFFEQFYDELVFDSDRFLEPERRLIVTVTNCFTGRTEFFEKGKTPYFRQAVQASATVPYVSEPVEINGMKYLDGGIASKIPLEWPYENGFDKVVLIRTRDRDFRKKSSSVTLKQLAYYDYPELKRDLEEEVPRYNLLCDRINAMEKKKQLFVIAPSEEVQVSRFEMDVEKLGDLYWLGYKDAQAALPALKEYLENGE